jgi:hypothetical protein
MGKITVENSLKISMSKFKKWGFLDYQGNPIAGTLRWSYGGEESARVDYKLDLERNSFRLIYKYRLYGEEWQNQDSYIFIVQTPCYFGGVRHWFSCPGCSKRVGCLYSVTGYFVCRHCNDLSYDSKNELKSGRIYTTLFRAFRLEEKVSALRTKYYKGKPTKRYARLIQKMDLFRQIKSSI